MAATQSAAPDAARLNILQAQLNDPTRNPSTTPELLSAINAAKNNSSPIYPMPANQTVASAAGPASAQQPPQASDGFDAAALSQWAHSAVGAPQASQAQAQPSDAAGFSANDLASWVHSVASQPIKAAPAPESTTSKVLDTLHQLYQAPGQVFLNQATQLGANIIGGLKGLSKLGDSGDSIPGEMAKLPGGEPGGWGSISTLAKGGSVADAARAVESEQQAIYQPPAGTVGANAVQEFGGSKNPQNWPGMAGRWLADKSQELGASPAVGAAIQTVGAAAPLALGLGAAGEVEGAGGLSRAAAARQWLQGKVDEVKGGPAPAAPATAPATAPAAADGAKVPFATSAPEASEGASVGAAERLRRAQVLSRIGLQNARESAISGDPLAAAIDAQVAKFPEPAGEAAAGQFADEKAALAAQAKKVVSNTGGTLGTNEDDLVARGQTIAAPFDALKNVMKAARQNLYSQADAQAGGAPSVQLNGLKDLLERDSAFQGKSENGALRNGINSYLKEQGILNKDGTLNPVTAQQAEGVRQYINSQWSPSTSGLAGMVKGTLDKDVMDATSGDTYKAARDMYAKEQAMLHNPSGIAKIMDYDAQTPINRATPYDKIPDTLLRMPPEQLRHIVNVLDGMPEELQPAAQAAKSEIKAQLANKLLDTGGKFQGQWNSDGVSELLNKNAAKVKMLFGPDEMPAINDLNDAGHILRHNASYPGAAAQAAIALKRGLMSRFIRPVSAVAGETAGSIMGLPGLGTAAGDVVGGKLANTVGERAALKGVQKRMVNLRDMLGEK